MAEARVLMHTIDEILRLHHECGRLQREVALSCQMSAGGVNKILQLASKAGLRWPLPAGLDEAELVERLYGRPVGGARLRGDAQGADEAEGTGPAAAVAEVPREACRRVWLQPVLRAVPGVEGAAGPGHAAGAQGGGGAVYRPLRDGRRSAPIQSDPLSGTCWFRVTLGSTRLGPQNAKRPLLRVPDALSAVPLVGLPAPAWRFHDSTSPCTRRQRHRRGGTTSALGELKIPFQGSHLRLFPSRDAELPGSRRFLRKLAPLSPRQTSPSRLWPSATPLLEEERHSRLKTLVPDRFYPLGSDRAVPDSALSSHDDPMNRSFGPDVAEVEWADERFATQKTHRRRDLLQVSDPVRGPLIFGRRADPDVRRKAISPEQVGALPYELRGPARALR